MNEISIAVPYPDNPAAQVLARYRRFQQVAGSAAGNPELSVDIAGFRRYRGDWIGTVVTPWFIHLLLLPGGGELWRDLADGERLRVGFPAGDLDMLSEHADDADVPRSFFCPILAPVTELAGQDAALTAAMDALAVLFDLPFAPLPSATAPRPPVDRRGFFRRLAGRT